MYQGKFSSKDKKGKAPQHVTEQPREMPVQQEWGMPRPDRNRPMPPQGRPMPPQGRPMPQRPVQPVQDPTRPMQQPPVQQPVKRHYGGLIFYIIVFACILAIYTFTYFKLGDLQNWLIRYEAAQPTYMYEQVFKTYFEHPNWGLLYDNAGVKGSTYEGKEAFVSYMEQKVGDTPLTGLETSAGLSRDKKYIVRLGDEKLASFTLVDKNNATEKTDIPNWQLGEIELFFQRIGTYYIETVQGQKVQVNGVPLDETATIRIATTRANEYLPEGVSAPMTALHQVDGLMVKPEITVTDANGNPVEVTYNEESRTFTVPAAKGQEISQAEKDLALEAIKTYAVYMSSKGGHENELAEYFERGTDLFKTFTSMERTWTQTNAGRSFSDDTVTDTVKYSDDLFSARVSTNLHLKRKDGTEKVTKLDNSMFFKKKNGEWKCYDMTAVNVSEPVEKVKLTFQNGDQILKSDFVDASVNQVDCPQVTAPDGKTFSGWVIEERKENGDIVKRIMLEPDENGKASVPADGLKPMVLMPLFE